MGKVIQKSKARRFDEALLALAVAAAACCPTIALGATDNWTDGTGNWSTPGNWSGNAVPGAGDTVNITESDGVNRTITYDYAGAAITLTSLTLDLTGAGSSGNTSLLSMAGNTVTSNTELIGNSGHGAFNQSDGVNTDNGGFGVGENSGSSGAYTLSNTGALVANFGQAIGFSGTGTFTQTGGTDTIASGNLNIGFNATGNGTYDISGGTLSLTVGNIYVAGNSGGKGGTGNLIVGAGAVVSIANTANITLYNSAASGLTLSGGTINTGSLNIPSGNTALFNWTAGTLNWNNASVNAIVDNTSSANLASTLNLGVNQTLSVASVEIIGSTGTGTVLQSGGMNNANGNLILGNQSGATGNYTLSGTGALTLPTLGTESIGTSGNGTFTQTGGTNTFGNGITIGSASSVGNYNLSGGVLTYSTSTAGHDTINGTFTQTGGSYAAGRQFIVNGGGSYFLSGNGTLNAFQETIDGNFTQSAGDNTGGDFVDVGNGGTGSYTLSGTGVLSGPLGIGIFGQGTFTQSGGTATLVQGAQPGSLWMGYNGSGSYALSSGLLSVTGSEIVGYVNSNSTFTQTGGTNNASGDLNIGQATTGSYSLSAGSAVISGSVNVGGSASGFDSLHSNGTLTVSGSGALTIGGSLTIYTANSTGVNFNGGTINTAGLNFNGVTSLFNWTAGTLNITSDVTWDSGAAATSTSAAFASALSLGTGQTLKISGNETLGGSGFFTLSLHAGSTHTVTGTLALAPNGFLNLAGGTLNTAGLNFNGFAPGFNWTAGTLNLTSDVVWDSAASPISTSSAFGSGLSLGTGQTLIISGNETLGNAGPFTLTLNSGSSHIVTKTLTINPGGALVLGGGSVNFTSLNQTGGTITGNLTVPVGASYNFTGGTLNGQLNNAGATTLSANFSSTSSVTNSGTLNIAAGVSVLLNTVGLNNSGAVNLSGGTIGGTAPLTNNGAIVGFGAIAGIFPSIFTNNGSLTQSGGTLTLNSGGGTNNAGTMNLGAAQVQFTGGTVTNSGTINLNATPITGFAVFINAAAGTITGSGSIATAFMNNGTIAVTTNTLTLPAFTNNGDIELAGITATLGGGTIVNNATIEGFGKISNAITNNATIEATGGNLIVTGALANSASGTLAVSTGNKILMQGASAFPTNAGLISLTGGTFDNGGQTLTNTGSIIGYGTLRTGGLTNSGNFTLSGGTCTVNGNVTNSPGRTINIKYQPAIFTGNITNNGTIKTTSTTVTFTGSYSGNAYISDPSTNIFQSDVTVVSGGQMTGGSGDQYYMSGGTFTNQGTFNNGGTLQSSDTSVNSGSFTEGGPQTWSPGTTFTNTAGTATFASDSGAGGANLSINANGGSVNFTSTQHLAALAIAGGATVTVSSPIPHSAVFTPSLSNSGLINLTSNDLVLQGTSGTVGANLLSIANELKSGFNAHSGYWNGSAGIISTAAATDTRFLTTLGYRQSAGALFDGSNTTTNDVLVKYTYYGDADLSGTVDGADYAQIDHGFGLHLTGWSNGDFNYDGVVNGLDYALIDNTFNQIAAINAAQLALIVARTNLIAAPTAIGSVPEPTAAALLSLAACAALNRRRRPRIN